MTEIESETTKGRKYQLILIGLLSMFFAEVCAGASPLWFFSVWSLLVTFPLYWAHILFFITLAIKTRRTTLAHLYLWGVLFGLYESWITKIIWAGYSSGTPIIPTILGFSVTELIVITLFWHPIFSFIMPILSFEILAVTLDRKFPNIRQNDIIILSHIPYIKKTRRNIYKAFGIVLIGATFLMFNSGVNITIALTTLIGTFAILWVMLKIGQRKAKYFSIYSLKLQKRGFIIVTIYLIMLYAITFPLIRPEAIPPLPTLLLTLCFYGIVIFFLYIYKPVPEEGVTPESENSKLFSYRDIKKMAIAFVVIAVVESTVPFVVPILFMIGYLSFIVAGLGIFLSIIVKIIKRFSR